MKRFDSLKLVDLVGKRSSTSARQDGDEMSEQASISTVQTSAGTPIAEAISDKSTEQAGASTSAEPIGVSPSAEQARDSTHEEKAIDFSEQPGVLKLKRLFRDFPRFKLPGCVDFGKLFSIGQKYIEFRPIIKIMLTLNGALPWIDRKEQRSVVETIVRMEEYIYELVELADTPYDPKEINELFCRLGCRLDYICRILQKTKVQRYSPFLIFGFDVYPSSNRRDLVMRQKNEDVDESFLRGIGKTQTYLRTRLDTKYLGEISRDHPEFGPSIQTVLSVYATMKYLTYEKQVEVFKHLYKLQETIKKLVLFKTDQKVDSFERHVPTLISHISTSFTELLEMLKIKIVPPRKTGLLSCEPCETVTKFVKNVNVKPEQFKKLPLGPKEASGTSVSYANMGISQERFGNLESLFHHLAAKKGAEYMYTFMYPSRVYWLEIARQYKEYRAKARQDLVQLSTWKEHIFWRLVEAEEVLAEARAFCDRIRGIRFTGNETLSDSIALAGELELLSSEGEDYMTSLEELIGQFLKYGSEYEKVSRRIRRSRFLFLTRDQEGAFAFPHQDH